MDEVLCIGLRGVYKDWRPMVDVRGEVPYFENDTGLDLEQMDYTVDTGVNCGF